MGLETGTYISDLVNTNPPDTDPKSQGAGHLRLIKSVIQNTWPNINGPMTMTQAQLNSIPTLAKFGGQVWTGQHDFTGATWMRAPGPVNPTDVVIKSYADALPFGGVDPIPCVAAGGTSDAITATYSPAITLSDTRKCMFVATAANTTTAPTFAPNGLTAHPITMNGGQPLVPGAIPGANFVAILEYNLANTRWELLNPKATNSSLPFGDGSDGNVTVNGALTLSRDMFYNNLTLTAGAAINTAGYRIYVAGTLDISAAPAKAIYRNGNNGTAGTNSTGPAGTHGAGGAALAAANLGGSTAGANGADGVTATAGTNNGNNGVTTTNAANGGATAASGAGGPIASATSGTSAAGSTVTYSGNAWPNMPPGLTMSGTTFSIPAGGAGAPSGGSGGVNANGGNQSGSGGTGGAGSGAGVIVIIANIIAKGSNTTAGIIQAIGGLPGATGTNFLGTSAPGVAGGGGSSGGGGGWVLIAFQSLTGSIIVGAIDVSGAAGAAGAAGLGTGSGGDGGASGGTGTVTMYNLGAGTLTQTVATAGVVGTAHSGINGGAGAPTNVKQVNL